MGMKIGTCKTVAEDETRLREMTRLYEDQIDQLNDDELTTAEAQIQERIHSLLSSHSRQLIIPPARPIIDRKPRPSSVWGGYALLVAALVLFMLRPETDLVFERTKGQLATPIACDLRLIQSDRSTPDRQEGIVVMTPGVGLFAEVHCMSQGYVHLALRERSGVWQWLVKNQPAEQGRTWLLQDQSVIDLTLYKGLELTIFVTRKALGNSVLPNGAALSGVGGEQWMDTITIVERQ